MFSLLKWLLGALGMVIVAILSFFKGKQAEQTETKAEAYDELAKVNKKLAQDDNSNDAIDKRLLDDARDR